MRVFHPGCGRALLKAALQTNEFCGMDVCVQAHAFLYKMQAIAGSAWVCCQEQLQEAAGVGARRGGRGLCMISLVANGEC